MMQNKHDQIEHGLQSAGWLVQNQPDADLQASLGVVVRDYPLARNYGTIDYLLHLEGKAVGLIEVQAETTALTGVPIDSEKYNRGLPFTLRLFTRPLPFLYQSSGSAIQFTHTFDPMPSPRSLCGFHRPETLRAWLEDSMVGETPRDMAAEYFPEHRRRGRSFHERVLINMPSLVTDGLNAEQIKVITNLETSFKENQPRALVEMKSGTERTLAAIRFLERLVQFADARRVLYLVNSADIGQRLRKFIQDTLSLDNNTPFTQSCPTQHLTDDRLEASARLCIATLPQIYTLLVNQDPLEENKMSKLKEVPPFPYNSTFPIESFDVVIIDTCNVSITTYFRPVLEYFDAALIGLTENPTQEAIDFFNQNLVMDYEDPQSNADGLNVISFD